MKICVLQPDYRSSSVAHAAVDPPRTLASLLPEDEVVHVFLHKATVYAQLRAVRREGFDIFVNLCEGYLDWDVPSIDVIEALDRLNLPYTGPSTQLYDPSKPLMKLCATYAGVATPDHVVVSAISELPRAAQLGFPLFAKPAHAGDSLGVDGASLCLDPTQLAAKTAALLDQYDEVLIERYIEAREFSVLVLAEKGRPGTGHALAPVEFLFPPGTAFKTYELKARHFLPDRNVACTDAALSQRLRAAAEAVFKTFDGVGYCRIDFRVDGEGTPFFIDANFACSVLYPHGHSSTADYILAHDGLGQDGFLRHIITEGLARHRLAQRPYRVAGSALNGYGIIATRRIAPGEIVFRGEGRAQRIVTRRHVAQTWPADQQAVFRRYAYPLSSEVFVLWDSDPAAWAPQNHSCDPNTAFDGLDVVARRAIAEAEELTLDYRTVCDARMEPFACTCRAANCQGRVEGLRNNTLTAREAAR